MTAKRYLSANEYLHDSWRLAAKVRKTGWRPDVLIALWRGGAPVGIALHEFFKTIGWKMRHYPVKCASYTGIGENDGEVVFSHADGIFGEIRQGERVLVVDDVFDTGKTAVALSERIAKTGAEMKFACVYWKRPKNETNLKPDYFANDVGTEWLVFPHEIEGLTDDEIAVKDPLLSSLLHHEN